MPHLLCLLLSPVCPSIVRLLVMMFPMGVLLWDHHFRGTGAIALLVALRSYHLDWRHQRLPTIVQVHTILI
jgi:hypothetical protein